jgi:hypothetical protein
MKRCLENNISNTMKKRKAKYTIEVEVSFVPFPSEEARKEAYRKWVRAFLSSKLNELQKKPSEFR